MNQRVWVFGVILLGLVGCAHQQTRLQKDDDSDRDKEAEVKTIGDVTTVANADAQPVSGVGLVVGLENTGAGAPPGVYRQILEDDLKKRGVTNVKEVLSSPTTSLVLVSAMLPPGVQKGDNIDIEVTLAPGSKTTSLAGGRLLECPLFNYDNTKNLDPNYSGPNSTLRGHTIVKAEGQLLVGLGDGDESGRLKQARIWSGGRSLISRPFFLVLNSDQQFARVAQVIADRVNETFHGSFHGPMSDLAVAKNKQVVHLAVPPQYKLNLPRYLRVVRLIPMRETEASRIGYMRRLEEKLLDPTRTVTAALRLEALGKDSVPVLKKALGSEHPLVRFCAAESLAYLGDPRCGEELAHAVEQQPVLRAFALTAMASLDEAVCHVELTRLLGSPSPETCYGAFRALRALDEHADAVQGDHLNESFWLHRVPSSASALVHLSSHGRPEIVLFGEEAKLEPPFPILAGEFTVTANKDDAACTITRRSLSVNKKPRQCSLKLEDVLRSMAEMGASYPDVIAVIRRADHLHCLNGRVAVDALPQATSVFELAKAGSEDPELLKTHREVLDAKADFGATPTLFETGAKGRTRSERELDEEAAFRDRQPRTDKKTAARSTVAGEGID